ESQRSSRPRALDHVLSNLYAAMRPRMPAAWLVPSFGRFSNAAFSPPMSLLDSVLGAPARSPLAPFEGSLASRSRTRAAPLSRTSIHEVYGRPSASAVVR